MPASLLLLRVATTWPLPGLGLLALPAGPTPHLSAHPLHSALAVTATVPDGESYAAIATVEEVTRPAAPTTVIRSLLLDFGSPVDLPPGTEIWLVEAENIAGS